MFDIGFWELTIIGVVMLLVIGPERLPGVARTAGKWFGQANGFVSAVKMEVNREIKADEVRNMMEKNASTSGLHDIIEEVQSPLKSIQEEVESVRQTTDKTAREIEDATGYGAKRREEEAWHAARDEKRKRENSIDSMSS